MPQKKIDMDNGGVYIKGNEKILKRGNDRYFAKYETYIPFEKAYEKNINLLKDNIDLAKTEIEMWY